MGIQLIEPYLTLTYYEPVTHEDIIKMGADLYNDLETTKAEDLLTTKQLVFEFAKSRLSTKTKICHYPKKVLLSLEEAMKSHKGHIIQVLELLLPKLANGWFEQRGNVFGFRPYDKSSPKLITNIPMNKLKNAPINNMSSERVVGAINYELGIRGAIQCTAASSAVLKGRSYDLIELKPAGEYLKHKKNVTVINTLIKDWIKKQKKIEDEGMTKKELAGLVVEKRRNTDLTKLKAMGGPFTQPKEVDNYAMNEVITYKEKQDRLYLEVRYARDTCLSLPKTSDLFRLKQNYQKMKLEVYITNLKTYLSKISAVSSSTMNDFEKAIKDLALNKT